MPQERGAGARVRAWLAGAGGGALLAGSAQAAAPLGFAPLQSRGCLPRPPELVTARCSPGGGGQAWEFFVIYSDFFFCKRETFAADPPPSPAFPRRLLDSHVAIGGGGARVQSVGIFYFFLQRDISRAFPPVFFFFFCRGIFRAIPPFFLFAERNFPCIFLFLQRGFSPVHFPFSLIIIIKEKD